MKRDFYNSNDEEYLHVIKLLKDLPRENAPDNFEYNLRVRIDNKNFLIRSDKSLSFFSWQVLVPATGAILGTVILFFTFFNSSEIPDNPFQSQPKLRNSIVNSSSSSVFGSLSGKALVNNNDVILNETLEAREDNLAEESETIKSDINQSKTLADYPFEDLNSTNLDEALNSARTSTRISRNASLVGKRSTTFFNGFFIREEVDKEYVEAMKARMDSLKKIMKHKQRKMKVDQ